MRIPTLLVLIALLVQAAGCSGSRDDTNSGPPPAAPTLEQLKNMTYTGVEETPVTLAAGEWEGATFQDDSELRPRVDFVGDFVRTGDVDGRPGDEAIVLLDANAGGTGENIYLAVAGMRDGRPTCLATSLLGDRVQVKALDLVPGAEGRIRLEVVRAGPDDAMCCPGEVATVFYAFGRTGLKPLAEPAETHRLSLADLGNREWVLRAWSWDEPAPAQPRITLRYADGKFTGNNGCNSYFHPVEERGGPGELFVGMGGATKKYCPDPAGEIELRFSMRMQSVRRFGFLAGQLALTYQLKDVHGVMLFEGREPAAGK